MILKVVFFRYIPLTELICKSHFMDWLVAKGITVEYLDLSKIFYPNFGFTDNTDRKYIIRISSYSELNKYLSIQNKQTTLFISIVTFEWRVCRLFRILTKHNCKLGVFARGFFPVPKVKKVAKLFRIIRHLNLKKTLSILKNRIVYWIKKNGWIKTYDVVYLTGSKAISAIGIGYQLDNKDSLIVEVNTADYDNHLNKSNKALVNESYAIFLDENLPYHPDTKLFGINTISEKDYFPELNRFFDRLEDDFNIKIIIAAHPKAINYKTVNPFDGREIIINLTDDLVTNSAFVIVHDSTSIAFAVLHQKPIISVTSLNLKRALPNNHAHVIAFSEFLNTCLIYYDKYEKTEISFNVDKERYELYLLEFLTNKSTKNKLTQEIFIESLKKL